MEKNNNFVKYLLFAMPLFFGVIGFVVIGHTPVLDALFCVMQMYVLNYGGTPANVFVELARWTAPLATMTGVGRTYGLYENRIPLFSCCRQHQAFLLGGDCRTLILEAAPHF
jgi:hypothetical protein